MIDGAIAGTRGAPPRRRIEGGGVVCHRRIVRGNGFADMCGRGVGGEVRLSPVALAISMLEGRDGVALTLRT